MKEYKSFSTVVVLAIAVFSFGIGSASASVNPRGEARMAPLSEGVGGVGDEGRQQLQANQPDTGEMIQQREEIREEAKLELKTRLQNKEQVRELTVGQSRAKLKDGGAQFSYDEETGEVKILTPSGKEHVLTHLPDVAIENMIATGFFDEELTDAPELEIDVNQEGELIYRANDFMNKKLFGIFPRRIASEIILNDVSGEVIEELLPASSFFQGLLNRLSF